MSNMVTNTEMDSVIPDLTTADRQYLVADGAARSIDCDGGLQVWDVSTVKRYVAIRQREKEKRYGYGSRVQAGRAHVRVADLLRQRAALRAVGRDGRELRGAWAPGDTGTARNANAHHPGYAAAVQALRTRGGEPTARFHAAAANLANGWGRDARRWLRELGHSGDELPEWECGERCDVEDFRVLIAGFAGSASPLITGTDVANVSDTALAILSNADAIAVNQDPLGLQASVVWQSNATPAIFITGGASGIGLECARTFLALGWFVGIVDVNEGALRDAEAQLAPGDRDGGGGSRGCGRNLFAVACDVTSESSFAATLRRFEQRSPGGRLDVLFNCAGLLRVGPMAALSLAEQRQELRVNVEGILVGVRAALPLLRHTPGSAVISMASLSSAYGIPTFAAYSASKHAVRALTEALALELEADGVRVCDVYVGFVNTPLLTEDTEARVPKRWRGRLLQERDQWADPAVVARAVVAAAAEDADPRVLHVCADWRTWVANKLLQLDALLGLGLARAGLRVLIMTPAAPAARL